MSGRACATSRAVVSVPAGSRGRASASPYGLGFVMEGGNRSKSHGNKNTNGPRHTVLING
jgi:hypothetical protein